MVPHTAAPSVCVRFPRARKRFARPRDGAELPDLFSCFHIIGGHFTANGAVAAGDADEHEPIVINGRRRRICGPLCGRARLPDHTTRLLIERDEHIVAPAEQYFAIGDDDTFVRAGFAFFRFRTISPLDGSGLHVDGQHVSRAGRDVHHSVNHDRRAVERSAPATFFDEHGPDSTQLRDIRAIDLAQRGVALVRVAAARERKVQGGRSVPVRCGGARRMRQCPGEDAQRTRHQRARDFSARLRAKYTHRDPPAHDFRRPKPARCYTHAGRLQSDFSAVDTSASGGHPPIIAFCRPSALQSRPDPGRGSCLQSPGSSTRDASARLRPPV